MRQCGICQAPASKQYCVTCTKRMERMKENIKKRLADKRRKVK